MPRKMTKRFEISRLLMLLCLPAVIWLISNNFVNKHYHILSNGVIISHSHPYCNCEEKPIQDHDHSDFEYSILAQITSNSSTESVEGYFVEFFATCTDKPYSGFTQEIITPDFYTLPRLRGPPENFS